MLSSCKIPTKWYPFGMLAQNYNAKSYRFGFNGHEKDNEVYGEGNYWSFGDYGYDPRISKRWNVEPLIDSFPYFSSYLVFGVNPINFKDEDGRSITTVNGEATQLMEATIEYFGGESFTNLIGLTRRQIEGGGMKYFASKTFTTEKKFKKELTKKLKSEDIMLNEEQLHQAYMFYEALSSRKNVEVAVLTKGIGSSPKFGDGNFEKASVVVESKNVPSKNKNIMTFYIIFEKIVRY